MTYLTSVADGIQDGGLTSFDSPSLTVSGTNKVMYVLAGNSAATPADPSSVVWNPSGGSQSATLISSSGTYGGNANDSLWRLIAPADATGVVRVTWAAAKDERYVIVWVETDIDQGTPNGTVVAGTGTTTTVAPGAVSTSSGQRVLTFAGAFANITFTLTSGNFTAETGIERIDGSLSTGTRYDAYAAQEQTAAGASVTSQWTLAQAVDGWGAHSFALNETGPVPPVIKIRNTRLRPRPFAPGLAR